MIKTIVLFHRDLRLHDNPALTAAAQRGVVIPVFVWSPNERAFGNDGSASRWWLSQSLHALRQSLAEYSLRLIVRQGERLAVINTLLQETGATAVYMNESYEPDRRMTDDDWVRQLIQKRVEIKQFSASLMMRPNDLLNVQGQPYRVYSAFFKKFHTKPVPRPLPVPGLLHGFNESIYTETIENLPLISSHTWHSKLEKHWKPGETEAIKRWKSFLKNSLKQYKDGKDFPGNEAVSKLSPHIAFGEISVCGIWHAIERERVYLENPKLHSSMDAFQKQLVWRDFSYHQLDHFPTMRTKPLRQPFEHFPWHTDAASLKKWMCGQTGYPIVDAGMRQLWETGWMHNRVRMIVASFLTKHLLISWQDGEKWFADTLVDFDMANNAMGWQWSAGSGNDAAPYFRIFNPILQGKKFDNDGDYVRKWIPELRLLPSAYIHEPWTAPQHILDAAQLTLGENYPFPIVDHSIARQRALEAYQQIK